MLPAAVGDQSRGYLKNISDIENVVVGATSAGTPVRVAELGRVTVGPAVRRGVAELDGRGDAVGGIVVMRFGQNALTTIERVKRKLKEVKGSLPEGVVITPVYDRSSLILEAIDTLKEKLLEESIVVALVCLIFLMHARSALVAVLTLPIGILMAFIVWRAACDTSGRAGLRPANVLGRACADAVRRPERTYGHLHDTPNLTLEPEER